MNFLVKDDDTVKHRLFRKQNAHNILLTYLPDLETSIIHAELEVGR